MKKRRIVSLLLALALVLSYMPALAFADDTPAAESQVHAADIGGEAAVSGGAAKAEAAAKYEETAKADKAAAAKAESGSHASEAGQQEQAAKTLVTDDKRVPVSIAYQGSTMYTPAYTEDGYEYDAYFDGFYELGNKITITYKDGAITYERKEFSYKDSDGEECWTSAYLPVGEEAKMVWDSEGYFEIENEMPYIYSEVDNATGKITLALSYNIYDESGDYTGSDELRISFQGKYAKSMSYTGGTAYYDEWEAPEDASMYQDGMEFTLSYSDGTSRKIVLKSYAEYEEDGEKWTEDAFFYEDEEPVVIEDDGYKSARNDVYINFDRDNYDAAKGMPAIYDESGRNLKCYIPLTKKVYPKPTKAEFIPASGFVAGGRIGEKYVYSWNLLGKGNKFIVTYDDKTTEEYVYGKKTEVYDGEKSTYEGFFCGDKSLSAEIALNKRIPKGTNTLSGKLEVEGPGYNYYQVPVTVTVKATKYYTQTIGKTYTYTGKKITPKPVVKYWTGKKMKTMPKSWYTCKPAKKSKVGGYEYKITIKKKYRSKFDKTLWTYWQIVPQKTSIKSASGGKGKITVSWAKFSKAKQKNISGYVIEYATKKNFSNAEWIEVKKTLGKKTVTDVEPGTYYVRVRTYKLGNYFGMKDPFWSNPSKTKKVVVK